MTELINILEANKNLILTGAPGTGKTFLAKKIAQEFITAKKEIQPMDILKKAIADFKPDIEFRQRLADKLSQFQAKFPIESLLELSLDDYCTGKGDRNNFCWWIENNLSEIGGWMPGSSFTYGIFYKKEANEWEKNHSLANESDEVALKKVLTRIIQTVSAARNQDLEALIVLNNPKYVFTDFLLRIIIAYNIKGFLPIYSTPHLKNCATKLNLFDLKQNESSVFAINKAFYKLYEQLCDGKDITPTEFMHIIYGGCNFDIKNGTFQQAGQEIDLSGASEFVQFHPSYDYTDFVEGLRPVKKGDKLGFELKNGIFKTFCKLAKENPTKKYVFIIDEINRAEISKVFGELFFALDPGYRGEKGKVITQYANLQTLATAFDNQLGQGEFYIPENVYIIGTMNDIDRSVESFDFAIRRRFAWKEITPKERIEMWEGKIDLWKDRAKQKMEALNKQIQEINGLGTAFQLGPAYFLKLENYKGDFNSLWENHLGVLLKEYLRGMSDADSLLKKLKEVYEKEVLTF